MTPRSLLQLAFTFLLFVAFPSRFQAGDAAPPDKAKIEALITHLEGLKDATFVRNGTGYDAATAAKFLRGKWQAHGNEIKTAADFIRIAATRSSTSGKPYLIRLKDNSEVPCADYLSEQLKKLEAGNQAATIPNPK